VVAFAHRGRAQIERVEPEVGSVTPNACSRSCPRRDLRQASAPSLRAAVPQTNEPMVYIGVTGAPLQTDAWNLSMIGGRGRHGQPAAAVFSGSSAGQETRHR
jgi:hypothetical protein